MPSEQGQVRGAGSDAKGLVDDQPASDQKQRSSTGGNGAGEGVQPLDESAFYHECEACGLRLLLTPEIAYRLGWDYPPRIGAWGVVSPRTCGNCGIEKTVWYALAVEKKTVHELTEEQYQTAQRIVNEKGTLR